MLKQKNYTTLQGWMVSELKLSGLELICYALIYGFTQDEESVFMGSRKYLSQWLGCSLPTVDKTLKTLIDKGLIEKHTEVINNVTFNRYKHVALNDNFIPHKKTLGGSKDFLGGAKDVLHNNNISNKKDNKEKRKIIDGKPSIKENEKGLFDNDETIVTISTNNQTNEKENDDAFVDKIYKMYPTKCPVRGTSLGKTHADKKRIKNLLKRYTQEQIEKVVESEIKNKQGKQYMKNFSTFLNNFPDPDAICDNTRPRNNEPVGFHLDEGVRERMREAKEDGSGEW